MNNINQKIIDAIIAKAEKICPNSLALIGVYGSFATGDIYSFLFKMMMAGNLEQVLF